MTRGHHVIEGRACSIAVPVFAFNAQPMLLHNAISGPIIFRVHVEKRWKIPGAVF